MRETLAALAPHGRDNPRIVLLTAGPYNATYFEQAFLAQYLGYTLVEGGDLTVRDGRVFLKTLGGLHPVDVILRRLNDDYCDPLELRRRIAAGRAGPAAGGARRAASPIANALGSGVVQTPALMPFLPALCRGAAGRGAEAAVGRDLVVRRAATSWRTSSTHLGEMVIKPAYPTRAAPSPIFGAPSWSDRRRCDKLEGARCARRRRCTWRSGACRCRRRR